MTRNEFNLLYAIKKHGLQSCRKLKDLASVSVGYASQTLKSFSEKKYIDDNGITELGLQALLPYKVDSAVIMAAGMSTRFVPLSLEKPKGLLEVKGEILIERQIRQLKEAGIEKIAIILGYKKEAFFYLENKYDGISIVINPEYNTKNNTHTLYLAQRFISNTYICSSDDYFVENPFEEYVYQSYYAAIHVIEKTNEWYMIPDKRGNISKVRLSGEEGDIMLGHVYWNREFSAAMIGMLNADHEVGNYDQSLWETILMEHVKELPPMEIKVYPDDVIFEFDSLDDLRSFDDSYVNNTHSRIMEKITAYLDCHENDILNLKPIKKGITNTSFVFEVNGRKYVYRHPGDGTEAFISRENEKKALELAKAIGADPTYIYMDGKEGWKISEYVESFRTPDYSSAEDSKRVTGVMKSMHQHVLEDGRAFMPWEEAEKLENILRNEKGGIADKEFDRLKADVENCYKKTVGDGVKQCFCHCDTYAQNWMLTDAGDTILIDWEYAGNADPGCDVGSYIMDSMWDIPEAEAFIEEYCGSECDDRLKFHYLAYTAVMSYFWYVWALYREACGAIMGESIYNWRVMAVRYSRHLAKELQ